MSRKTNAAAAFLVLLAIFGAAILFYQRPEPVSSPAATAPVAVSEKSPDTKDTKQSADITFSFPGIPVEPLIETYEGWAKKKVAPPKDGWPFGVVHATTTHPLTTNEALQLIEDALKQQARVVIHHSDDGNLSAEVLVAAASP